MVLPWAFKSSRPTHLSLQTWLLNTKVSRSEVSRMLMEIQGSLETICCGVLNGRMYLTRAFSLLSYLLELHIRYY